MAPEALLFDIDCTLWDSPTWYSEALEDLVGVNPSDVFQRLLDGSSIVSIIEQLGVSRGRFVRGCLSRPGAPAYYSNVRETLSTLSARGLPMGVFTSLPGTIAEPLLTGAGIASIFTKIVHAGNCKPRKPNPKGILVALEALGVDPSQRVCYVGDSRVDAATARNAGVSFAWVSYAYERMPSDKIHYVIDHFEELESL